jgi:monoamine oxidase
MSENPDVIVVGAGAAGLAASIQLARSGLLVTILEARDRIGGRMFMHRDPALHSPIAMGAEFIHGLPSEIWEPLQARHAPINEVSGDVWCSQNGELSTCDFFSEVDQILKKMDTDSPDESFLNFVARCFPESKNNPKLSEAKKRAVSYVKGFNAADPSRVGVHWLVQGMKAEEKIQGDRAFRSENGYEDLLDHFRQEIREIGVVVHRQTIVDSISWSCGGVEIDARKDDEPFKISAPRVLITLPLGVMKAAATEKGAVRIAPTLPRTKLGALQKLEMGKVIRVVLRFRERFWDKLSPPKQSSKDLSAMSFLLSEDEWFPAWWTSMPDNLPIITGWAPFDCAERLSGRDRSFVTDRALQTLGNLLHANPQTLGGLLEAAYFHDWQNDPFSRGAYSYGAVGSGGAQEALASPLENTLFFAGEATDTGGHNGTVHGAIASGHRAAQEILGTIGAPTIR